MAMARRSSACASSFCVRSTLLMQAHGADDEPPGVDAVRLLARGAKPFLGIEMRLDRGDDLLGDVVLDGEDVLQLAVVFLGPDVLAGLGVDQLAGDADAPARRPDAALQHVAHAEFAGDLPHVHGFALVDEGRVAGDDEQPAQARERRDDVLGDAVGEVILLGIAAHVGEWQDGDRGLAEGLQVRASGALGATVVDRSRAIFRLVPAAQASCGSRR